MKTVRRTGPAFATSDQTASCNFSLKAFTVTQCVIAEFRSFEAAKLALEALEVNKFTLEEVSVVSSVNDPAAVRLKELEPQDSPQDITSKEAPGRTTTDHKSVGLGMLIGGSVAAPIAAATLIGPVLVAGPLVGMAVGAAVGGLLKSTSEWGVDLDATKDYEKRVKNGAVLIIVHSENRVSLDEAEAVLKTIGPDSIRRFA